jgi:L-iditol 2-dehydrogenase
MLGRRVVFSGVGKASLETYDIERPAADQILIETKYGVISPGTERATLLAEPNTPTRNVGFPFYPGYSNIGEVREIGSDVENFRLGDLVATIQTHSSHIVLPAILGPGVAPDKYKHLFISAFSPKTPVPSLHHIWKLPPGLSENEQKASATFAIWVVGLNGVRKARIELGEPVLVMGLGPIGLAAACHARLAGGFPILGLDLSATRRAMATEFGLDGIFADAAALEGGHSLMRSSAPSIVIEATGRPEAVPQAFRLCADHGRVVLTSSTRGNTQEVDFYTDVHRKGLTIIGAHESVRPVHENRPGYWTAWDDRDVILRLMQAGRLDGAKLLSHEFAVEQVEDAYRTVIERQDALTVLLKW